jgi:hypothetical protein
MVTSVFPSPVPHVGGPIAGPGGARSGAFLLQRSAKWRFAKWGRPDSIASASANVMIWGEAGRARRRSHRTWRGDYEGFSDLRSASAHLVLAAA